MSDRTYPSSYYTGPLGQNNILPDRNRAFLFMWPDGSNWQQQRDRFLYLEEQAGRCFDGLGIHYGGGGTFGGAANCMWNFYEQREQWIHDRGGYPLVSWSPDVSLSVINSGSHDPCLRNAADYFKSFGFRIMLRLFWEFNGTWLPWSGTGQAFINAWRRVVEIFQQRGATNVGFWWCPQEGYDRPNIPTSYPGDQYVDWVGSDAYNWCYVGETSCWSGPLGSGWTEFSGLFNYGTPTTVHDMFGPQKPFVIGETNTVFDPSHPEKKGQWYRNVPAAAKKMQYLVGVQFFEINATQWNGPRADWRVDRPLSEPSVFQGFLAMAQDQFFKEVRFRTWPLGTDNYNHNEFADNWDKVDAIFGGPIAGSWPSEKGLFEEIKKVADGAIPLGTLFPFFRPNLTVQIPSGYEVADGRTLNATQHDFPGGGNVTLPDLRNRFVLGAKFTDINAPGAPADSPLARSPDGAPGPQGVGGSNTVVLTSKTMPRHSHSSSLSGWSPAIATWYFQNSTYEAQKNAPKILDGRDEAIRQCGYPGCYYEPERTAPIFPASENFNVTMWGNGVHWSAGAGGYMLGQHRHTLSNISTVGSNTAHENRPRYIGLIWLIKVKNG